MPDLATLLNSILLCARSLSVAVYDGLIDRYYRLRGTYAATCSSVEVDLRVTCEMRG